MDSEEDDVFEYSDEEDGNVNAFEDDTDQVQWEDVAEDQGEPMDTVDATWELKEADEDSLNKGQEATIDTTSLNTVDWARINRDLQQQDAEESNKPKRKIVRMSNADKQQELALHKAHLLLLLGLQLRWNALTASQVAQGLLLSLTNQHGQQLEIDDSKPMTFTAEVLVRWFQSAFQDTAQRRSWNRNGQAQDHEQKEEDELIVRASNEIMSESRLLNVFFARVGSGHELAVLFTTLCRTLGIRSRHCVALDPLLVQHRSTAYERAAGILDSANAKSPFDMWTELWDPINKHWIAVDAVHRSVNQPQEIANRRGKSAPFSYVVSIDANGRVTDVTPRYSIQWSKIRPLRLANDWIIQTINRFNASIPLLSASTEAYQQLMDQEQEELAQMIEGEEMPTTLEGFRKHHLYCLERHLGQREVLYPRKPIGICKGLAVFRRQCVQQTRTKRQWRSLGRDVLKSELSTPAKLLKASSGDTTNDSDFMVNPSSRTNPNRQLYGIWQTEAVDPGTVMDGIVPKNAYGNIEIWSPAHLPHGSVHLRLPKLDRVAQNLGVDFAPAVVGFEIQNGRNCPRFDGIVVPTTAQALLVDAHAHFQQQVIEKAIRQNQQRVIKRWERLTKRVLLQHRLNEDYGKL